MISALKSSLDSPRKARMSRISVGTDEGEVIHDSDNWMAVGGALKTRGMSVSALPTSRMSVASDGSLAHQGGLKRAKTAPTETLDSLVAENEALGERVFELEEQNRMLLGATRELEDLRAEVAEHDHVTHAKTNGGSMKQRVAKLEVQLMQAEERCGEAARLAKAEEEAKEHLQQQLSDSEARHASMREELTRLSARLVEVQKQGQDALAELGSTKSTLEEVQATLQYERQCLAEEREKVHKLEEEVDDLAASKAAQGMRGRQSRSDKRLVTHNLLSQLDLRAMEDEDEEDEEEERGGEQAAQEETPAAEVAKIPTLCEEDSTAAFDELNMQCEDLKKQLASASQAREAAAEEAKALKEQASSTSREKEASLAAAEDLQRRLDSVHEEKEAALAETEELRRQLDSARREREGVLIEMQAALDDLRRELEHARHERDEAVSGAEAIRGSVASSSQPGAADQAARDAEHSELQHRLLTLERALELEQKTSRVLKAELHSPWWNRLTCFAKRPHHDGGDVPRAAEAASPLGPPGLHLQMPPA